MYFEPTVSWNKIYLHCDQQVYQTKVWRNYRDMHASILPESIKILTLDLRKAFNRSLRIIKLML